MVCQNFPKPGDLEALVLTHKQSETLTLFLESRKLSLITAVFVLPPIWVRSADAMPLPTIYSPHLLPMFRCAAIQVQIHFGRIPETERRCYFLQSDKKLDILSFMLSIKTCQSICK